MADGQNPVTTATPGFEDYNPQTPSPDAGTPGYHPYTPPKQTHAGGFQDVDTVELPPQAAPAPAAAAKQQPPSDSRTIWQKAKDSVLGPGSALTAPLSKAQQEEFSGVADIARGNFGQGLGKVWDAEKIKPENVGAGSPVEWAIRQFDPDFHGTATKESVARMKADSPGGRPLVDLSQFVDKSKHPIAKAVSEVASGLTSPENIAIMYATGGMGLVGKTPQAMQALGALNRLVSAGFSWNAITSAYEHFGAFRQAFNNGDANEAEYQLTHGLLSGTMAVQAGTHAAGREMPALSDMDKAVLQKIGATTAAASVGNFAQQRVQGAVDAAKSMLGTTSDFNTAVTRASNMLGKKAGPEFSEKVGRVDQDLKAILNDPSNASVDSPKAAADAIDRHLNSLEAPLQAKAGALRDSTEAVVPNFNQRLEARLDKFFDDNRQKFGGAEEVESAKQRILDRLEGQHDLGNGVKVPREINLYEAENARQGLNKIAKNIFEQGPGADGFKAAAADTANFLRDVIDEAYDAKGVTGVKEVRAKEADLIDIEKALRDAQGKFEAQGALPGIVNLFKTSKSIGLVGTLLAAALSHPIVAATGLATLWSAHYAENIRDLGGNLERAQELAAREPGARATETGTAPPSQGPTTPPPTRPGAPPMPQPPAPPTRPSYNHKIGSKLASYFGQFIEDDPAKRPDSYNDLKQRFANQVADMKNDIATQGGKYTQPQIDRAMKIQEFINDQHAAEDESMEKQHRTDTAKYQRDLGKWKSQYELDSATAEKEAKEAADAAEQKRVADILADERVAHGPVMKAIDKANVIESMERPSNEAHGHEHGHIMANVAEGNVPLQLIAAGHPDAVEAGALAQLQTDVADAMTKGTKGLASRVVGHLGGPAFDEVHYGTPLHRNTGARSDIAQARRILREEGGLQGDDLNKIFDALYERAKEHVSNPEALAIVQANMGLREAGLHPNFHISAGRMGEYIKKLEGAYRNGKPPADGGVRGGTADERVPERESADTGAEGKEPSGTAKGTPAKEVRESNGKTEGRGKREASNIAEIDHDEVLEGITRAYGAHDDPKLQHSAGFITPDARYIDLPSGVDHTDAIEQHGGGSAKEGADNRKAFINETGAVRVHQSRERAGNVTAYSVPKRGLTEDQVSAIERSVGANADRNGVLRIERADVSAANKDKVSTEKDFPRASDVRPMLEKIGAIKPRAVEKSALSADAGHHTHDLDWQESEKEKPTAVAGAKTQALPEGSHFVEATPEEHRAALDANPQGATLATETPAEMKNYKIYKMVTPDGKDTGIQYHITPSGEAGGLINNGPYKGATKVALDHAQQNGATHANSWDIGGALPGLYEKHGLVKTNAVPYDTATYGEPPADLKAAWKAAGWKEGDPYPSVQNYAFPKAIEKSNLKGSTVPIMQGKVAPEVKGTGEKGKISTVDAAKALMLHSGEEHPALELNEENAPAMVKRAAKIAEDEAKYQLAQGKTGKEWYTEEMKEHDDHLTKMRPELLTGPKIDVDTPWAHSAKLSLFKAAEAVLSSGQKPYGNFKSAVKAWDAYNETGEFPRLNPETGKSWGPRGEAAYGNALDMLNTLIKEKGEKGAAEWLLSEHPVSELKAYNKDAKGPKDSMRPGAIILGEKRGPFMQNLHGIESAFTADMWVSRTWNRWMGTMEFKKDPKTGEEEITTDSPRNQTERNLMKESFSKTADKLNLSTSALQAVLWYYEQALYGKMGIPKESWSFRDAAARVAKEQPSEEEQGSFGFGANKEEGAPAPAKASAIPAGAASWLAGHSPSKFVK